MNDTPAQNNYAEPQIEPDQQVPHNPVTAEDTGQKPPRGLLPERKKSWYRFTIALFIIFIIAMIGLAVFEKYFSPEAKQDEQERLMEQQTLQRVRELETALRNDTMGGKTPEETLALFLDALKKDNIDLAGQYFALNTNEQSPYYLTRQEWIDGLNQQQKEGKIQSIIDIVEKMILSKRDTGSKDSVDYILLNKDGMAEHSMSFEFNRYSNVWKIESM